MAKFFTFLFLLIGLEVILYFAGISTGAGTLLNALGVMGQGSDLMSSSIYSKISLMLTLAAAASIIVGVVFRDVSDSTKIIPVILFLLAFVMDYVGILNYVRGISGSGWETVVISIIFIPLILGFLISGVEWWRGTD
jgi:hypothetical protein